MRLRVQGWMSVPVACTDLGPRIANNNGWNTLINFNRTMEEGQALGENAFRPSQEM